MLMPHANQHPSPLLLLLLLQQRHHHHHHHQPLLHRQHLHRRHPHRLREADLALRLALPRHLRRSALTSITITSSSSSTIITITIIRRTLTRARDRHCLAQDLDRAHLPNEALHHPREDTEPLVTTTSRESCAIAPAVAVAAAAIATTTPIDQSMPTPPTAPPRRTTPIRAPIHTIEALRPRPPHRHLLLANATLHQVASENATSLNLAVMPLLPLPRLPLQPIHSTYLSHAFDQRAFVR